MLHKEQVFLLLTNDKLLQFWQNVWLTHLMQFAIEILHAIHLENEAIVYCKYPSKQVVQFSFCCCVVLFNT